MDRLNIDSKNGEFFRGIVGISTLTIFTTSMLVGLLMKRPYWFSLSSVAGAVLGTRTANQFKGRIQYLSEKTDDSLETAANAIASMKTFIESFARRPDGERVEIIDLVPNVQQTDDNDDVLEIPTQKEMAARLVKNQIFALLTVPLIACSYTCGLTAFTVGHFALPRIVAIGSGLTAGATLGVTCFVMSTL
jgi:hypothetical protein